MGRTTSIFSCGNDNVNICDKYVYLGLHLSEHLDYNIMAKYVSQSAGRALGLLIVKYKNAGGLPYNVFTKLFDSMVWPVINYGAAIWGTRTFSCIDAVLNRAMRFYLGTGKYTPNAAVIGDMGWEPTIVRQINSVCSFWARCVNMEDNRTNKLVFKFCADKAARTRCKNWCCRVTEILKSHDLGSYTCIENNICKQTLASCIKKAVMERYKCQWSNTINMEQSRSGNGGNKLRTYKLFKQSFGTESYVKMILPQKHRSSLRYREDSELVAYQNMCFLFFQLLIML